MLQDNYTVCMSSDLQMYTLVLIIHRQAFLSSFFLLRIITSLSLPTPHISSSYSFPTFCLFKCIMAAWRKFYAGTFIHGIHSHAWMKLKSTQSHASCSHPPLLPRYGSYYLPRRNTYMAGGVKLNQRTSTYGPSDEPAYFFQAWYIPYRQRQSRFIIRGIKLYAFSKQIYVPAGNDTYRVGQACGQTKQTACLASFLEQIFLMTESRVPAQTHLLIDQLPTLDK